MSILAIPPLIFIPNNDTLIINVRETSTKFSQNASYSGTSWNKPYFSYDAYLMSHSSKTYSGNNLPFLQFKRNTTISIIFNNTTSYFSNFHFHGLNTPPDTDGVSQKVVCGPNTQYGNSLEVTYEITNNSMVGWYHPHMVYITGELSYSGLYGMFEVIDDFSKKLDKYFSYGDNYAMLVYWDIDLNSDGSYSNAYINNKDYRSKYGVINNQVCIQWTQTQTQNLKQSTSAPNTSQYVTAPQKMSVINDSNLYKLTILNGTVSFRSLYLGVCDENKNIKSFHFVQTDCGLREPLELTILKIAPAERVTIVIDLNEFTNNNAYVFFYDFDLTDDDTSGKILTDNCGYKAIPDTYNLNIYLEVTNQHPKHNNLKKYLNAVAEIVLGQQAFANEEGNYLNNLNPNYFYNLPTINNSTPLRQIVFNMPTTPDKSITEFVSMQPRVYADMWNDYEYNMWKTTKSTSFLPTCLFNITPTKYYDNFKFISNDQLTVTIFNSNNETLVNTTIRFVETKIPLNIIQWTTMINDHYSKTYIGLPDFEYLGDILTYEWSDFLYNVGQPVNKQQVIIKTVLINNINKSNNYSIQLSAHPSLLMLFGKAIGSIVNTDTKMIMGENPFTTNKNYLTNKTYFFYVLVILSVVLIGLQFNSNILSITVILVTCLFYYFAIYECIRNSNFNIQKIIACGGSLKGMKIPLNGLEAELNIKPNCKYSGMPNGYANENFFTFCVQQEESERWLFVNADGDNCHPLHFHMTSGFADVTNTQNSSCITNPEYNYNLTYSKDVYSIGALQSLLFYLKFSNFNFVTNNIIPYLGYSFHCHFLLHHDMAMMSQFGVYKNKQDYF